jgi:hypothetical protein
LSVSYNLLNNQAKPICHQLCQLTFQQVDWLKLLYCHCIGHLRSEWDDTMVQSLHIQLTVWNLSNISFKSPLMISQNVW